MPAIKFRYATQARKSSSYQLCTIDAESEPMAEKLLLERNIPVLHIERHGAGKAHPASRPVSRKELIFFAEKMEQVFRLGMSLLAGIDLCMETSQSPQFRKILLVIRETVEKGGTLSSAMRQFPRAFDALTISLVSVGEAAGIMDKAFEQIKLMHRRNHAIRRKILGVMIYPAIVLTVATLCLYVLMWKTVPSFVSAFADAGVALPAPTIIVMSISHFTVNNPAATALILLLFILGLWNVRLVYLKCPRTHRYVLRIPVVGGLQRKLLQANFARTLAQLMEAQMQLISALRLCRIISSNYECRAAIARATVRVSRGQSLRESFAEEKDVLSPLLVRALAFGEKTGNTQNILKPLAEMLDNELNDSIDHAKTILEPVLILLIGGVVLFIMLAIFIPIFRLPKVL